jgi:site-specific recombinase XerD
VSESDLVTIQDHEFRPSSVTARFSVPSIVAVAGDAAKKRFIEFFAATIRNKNTRQAYYRAVVDFFKWCDDHGFQLHDIEPVVVAAYIEYQCQIYAAPSVKQQLAAIRMLFDWLVIGQVIPMNPSASVRGPKHIVKTGKTMVLTREQARQLVDSIDLSKPIGLRDRALIGVMVYSFARISAVVGMNRKDYFQNGKRCFFKLLEKNGKWHQVPCHHRAELFLDEYLEDLDESEPPSAPLFRTANSNGMSIKSNRLTRQDALRMIKRRAINAGLSPSICCHTFRATGITAYLENGGTIENAQAIAAHESPRTTKLYDRTGDEITLDEIEKIQI